MQIVLNGEPCDIAEGTTLLALVESLGLDPARVAVELDFAIIRQPNWVSQVLAPGANVEIVHFVGGG